MIIGNGMLAKAFIAYKNIQNIIIFASGVSNSKEVKKDNFNREKELLLNNIVNHNNKLLVYFSTCSIEDESQKNSHYMKHKQAMEDLVKTKCLNYYIFRLPQVVGDTNSLTLVNFLIDSISNNNKFFIQQYATRNLIDVDDVFIICNELISKKKYLNETTNVASPFNIKVIEIVNILENILDKKAIFDLTEEGGGNHINIEKIQYFISDIFKKNYLKKILIKKIK
jgi:nucleoside-diphosphate-sugar epimerase